MHIRVPANKDILDMRRNRKYYERIDDTTDGAFDVSTSDGFLPVCHPYVIKLAFPIPHPGLPRQCFTIMVESFVVYLSISYNFRFVK